MSFTDEVGHIFLVLVADLFEQLGIGHEFDGNRLISRIRSAPVLMRFWPQRSCLVVFLCPMRVPYFPTMCETSFSFSMQMYSISSVPVTNCQVTFTVQGLV